MKNGRCPKCQSTEVYKKKSGLFSYGGIRLIIATMATSPIDTYVCTSCAYVETYAADESKLKTIASKWEKA